MFRDFLYESLPSVVATTHDFGTLVEPETAHRTGLPVLGNSGNFLVWMDWTASGTLVGRIVIELDITVRPMMAENFRRLCAGNDFSTIERRRICYEGSRLHRILPGCYIQGGVLPHDGDDTDGESVFGQYISEDGGSLKFDSPGVLAMAVPRSIRQHSQFFITTVPTPWMDGIYPAIGRVVAGLGTLAALEKLGSISGEPEVQACCTGAGECTIVDLLGWQHLFPKRTATGRDERRSY